MCWKSFLSKSNYNKINLKIEPIIIEENILLKSRNDFEISLRFDKFSLEEHSRILEVKLAFQKNCEKGFNFDL